MVRTRVFISVFGCDIEFENRNCHMLLQHRLVFLSTVVVIPGIAVLAHPCQLVEKVVSAFYPIFLLRPYFMYTY